LGWSTCFIFPPSLSVSAVRWYFKSLIYFWSHYVQQYICTVKIFVHIRLLAL
jgi:hypothetical protein